VIGSIAAALPVGGSAGHKRFDIPEVQQNRKVVGQGIQKTTHLRRDHHREIKAIE